jgi:hypothetical protein
MITNRPYRRTEIDKIFNKSKASMQLAALMRGGYWSYTYIDVYTGKNPWCDLYDYEPLDPRGTYLIQTLLTDEQIAFMVNCPENKAVTDVSISLKAKDEWKIG